LSFRRPIVGLAEGRLGVANEFCDGIDGFCHGDINSFREMSLPLVALPGRMGKKEARMETDNLTREANRGN
jgi:hypothetical protein